MPSPPHGGRIWLGSLIRLLAPLGLSERLVRTSVFRLAKEGWLATETRGRRADYLLTPAGRRRFDEASRHIYSSHAPLWDRRWRLILVVGELDAKERDSLRRALFWQGFGVLDAATFIHPSAELGSAFDALVAEGLAPLLGKLLPLLAAESRFELSASDNALVRRAWDFDELGQAYAGFVATYLPILAELRRDRHAAIAPEEAFLLRTLLIHDYRRLLLRDPELPDVFAAQRLARPAGAPPDARALPAAISTFRAASRSASEAGRRKLPTARSGHAAALSRRRPARRDFALRLRFYKIETVTTFETSNLREA
jgi:phenylacetic acid degradation operon negative regulatory protein